MSADGNLITSPVGEIQFMAAEKPTKDEKYTVKLAFDSKVDKEFLAQISAINKAVVVTSKTYRGESEAVLKVLNEGKSMIEARTKFKPTVWDSQGNELDEAPMFFKDGKGTAQMIVSPFKGTKGGSINLVGIIIHSIENAQNISTGGDRETRLAQLRAAVDAATKG